MRWGIAVALALVGAMSVFTLALAALDKSRARRGKARVSERALLLAALAGGSPGLVLAMVLLRHKTRKPSFLAKLALVLILQAIALALLLRA